jgi:probable H4MPT-linked C1 transfer pathway protein
MPLRVLALDIGGANLKAAHSAGTARSAPFELWRQPSGLAAALRTLIESFPEFDCLAVTMTGELCDCFPSRREGVVQILDSVAFVGDWLAKPVRVWRTDGRLVDLDEARGEPLLCAAANWLPLATYAGRLAPSGAALLIDIGSTTTDIIPIHNGIPVPAGRTDTQRLRSGELVYTGVKRTPVCALLGDRGAAEWFATTQDVYLLLGHLAEQPDDQSTADGRPATAVCAHARLARMICSDAETLSREEAEGLAQEICDRQVAIVEEALNQVAARLPQPPQRVILSGSGEFLACQVLARSAPAIGEIISLKSRIGAEASEAACAFALAQLAAEMLCE